VKFLTWVFLLLAVAGLGSPVLPADKPVLSSPKLVAFYFHTSQRCVTCVAIENYTKEALNSKFGDALRKGIVEWRVVNVEQPQNRHFIRDFRLVSPSVVVVRLENGKSVKWQTLDKTWTLVRNKAQFIQYVQSSIDKFLEN